MSVLAACLLALAGGGTPARANGGNAGPGGGAAPAGGGAAVAAVAADPAALDRLRDTLAGADLREVHRRLIQARQARAVARRALQSVSAAAEQYHRRYEASTDFEETRAAAREWLKLLPLVEENRARVAKLEARLEVVETAYLARIRAELAEVSAGGSRSSEGKKKP